MRFMRMKKLFTLAVLAAVALSASAVEVPYSSATLQDDGWTTLDYDKASSTSGRWKTDYFGQGWMHYGYCSYADGDDYLTSPGLDLKAGWTYTVSYTMKTDNWGAMMDVLLCSGDDSASLKAPIKELADYPNITNKDAQTNSNTFTVSEDGTYYISFHCKSRSDQGDLWIQNFSITGEGGSEPVEKKPADLSFDSESYDYTFSDTYYNVPALNNPNNLSGIKWSSSDTSIASFGTSGNITLRKAGSATNPVSVEITASFEGNELFEAGEAKYTLNIYKGKGVMSFDREAVEITFGEDLPEVALTKPFDRIIPSWNSSDTNVATVNNNGEVSVVGVGTTTITASVTSTDLWDVVPASYTVTVKEKAPFNISPVSGVNHAFNVMDDPTVETDEASEWSTYTWGISGVSSAKTYDVDIELNGYEYVTYVIMPGDGTSGGFKAPARRAVSHGLTFSDINETFDGLGWEIKEVALTDGKATITIPVAKYNEPSVQSLAEGEETTPTSYTVAVYPGKADTAEGGTGLYSMDAFHRINSAVTYSSTVGVAGIEAEQGEAEYYNLQGVRVVNPEKGIYVRVQNGKASKVIL